MKALAVNDNFGIDPCRHQDLARSQAAREEQIATLRALALRAVTKPESLTMGEIQEVGWGVLILAKTLAEPVPSRMPKSVADGAGHAVAAPCASFHLESP